MGTTVPGATVVVDNATNISDKQPRGSDCPAVVSHNETANHPRAFLCHFSSENQNYDNDTPWHEKEKIDHESTESQTPCNQNETNKENNFEDESIESIKRGDDNETNKEN